MKVLKILSLLTLLFAIEGCRKKSPASLSAKPEDTPISLAEWRTMPSPQKYEPEVLERLKIGEPKMQNQKEWDVFYHAEFEPGRKRDLASP
ncbi:MAG: hypothetical protein K8T89_25460 [Planctomycetes bacterium]|nr:hypothetical protein [Planctomycetota bacterium]